MADEYGITPQGFKVKPFEMIKTETQEAIKQGASDQFNFAKTGSVIGVIVSAFSLQTAFVWQSQERVANSTSPKTAENVALDCSAAIVNSKRTPESYSFTMVEITGTPGKKIPKGWVRTVKTTGSRFKADIAEDTPIPDVTSQPLVLRFVAEQPGPVEALANRLTEGAALPGVDSVTNPQDAILGAFAQSDKDFRIKRDEDINAKGGATIPSIKSALRNLNTGVNPVIYATVFENVLKVVDTLGRPASCIHPFMIGGEQEEIVRTIFEKKAAGIESHGSIKVLHIDEDGDEFLIGYDEPGDVNLYYLVQVIETNDQFPDDGLSQIETSLLAFGSAQAIGNNVIYDYAKASYLAVKGIVYSELYIDTNPITAPTATQQENIQINELQIARTDSGRITVEPPT